ncbi:MAG: hypothetical protein ABJ308_06030 [Halieaceae bacterium]
MRTVNRYILVVLVLILLVYLALLDTLAKPVFEEQATEFYGAEVSVDSLKLSPFVGKVTLYQLQVADRRNAAQNLVQADRAYIDIDIIKLASDIIEIEDMEVDGLLVFGQRQQPATILRPLLPEDSDIAQAGLPRFDLPDVDSLVEQQRVALDNDIAQLNESFASTRTKWQEKFASMPSQQDVNGYKDRIQKLKETRGVAGKLKALQEVNAIYTEVNQDIANMRSMRQEFHGDIQHMREQIDLATQLPQKHVNALISSLGLSSEQMAHLGSQILRGDLDGLMEQVLAPLTYSADGDIDPEQTIPILIRRAVVSGALLPSAKGLSAKGSIENFAWPLETAQHAAKLALSGTSPDGGSLQVNALVDHRGEPLDRVTVEIERLPLRNMQLAGIEGLDLELLQALANVSGNLEINGETLQGDFNQRFSKALFETTLGENAGAAARLIEAVLANSTDFALQVNFAGTLQSPQLSFSSGLDQLIESTLSNAISAKVGELTRDLQNRISSEIGPEIAAARAQFASLEKLQQQLQQNLQALNSVQKKPG